MAKSVIFVYRDASSRSHAVHTRTHPIEVDAVHRYINSSSGRVRKAWHALFKSMCHIMVELWMLNVRACKLFFPFSLSLPPPHSLSISPSDKSSYTLTFRSSGTHTQFSYIFRLFVSVVFAAICCRIPKLCACICIPNGVSDEFATRTFNNLFFWNVKLPISRWLSSCLSGSSSAPGSVYAYVCVSP